MKIKSINNVITNSSDEVYIIKTDKSAQEVLKELIAMKDPEEHSSGMGGILNVETATAYVGNDLYYKHDNIPEGFAYVTVDDGFTTLNDYLRPLHNRHVENLITLVANLKWTNDWIKFTKITPEMLEIIPDLKDKLKETIESMNKLYENTFSN